MLLPSDEMKLRAYFKEINAKYKMGWQNFSRNRRLSSALVVDIKDKHTLQLLMRKINGLNAEKKPSEKITLRAAAGGKKNHADAEYSESFSFSPCAEADIIIRLTGSSFQHIKVDKKRRLARVGAGIQIAYLDKTLYEKYKLVLPTSSLFGYPTATGLAANAGHGTGIKQTSFAGLIQSLTICRPDGEIEEINADYADFETIRAAHLGLFGIVIEQSIKCISAKKLYCVMDATTVQSLDEQVKAGLFNQHRYVSVMYVPTYRKDEKTYAKDDNVLILKWNPVPLHFDNMHHCPALNAIGQDLSVKLQQAFQIPDILAKYPKLIPHYMRYLVSNISVGEDKEAIGPWHEMMHYQTAFPWKIDDADYLFQVSEDHHEINDAMNFVIDTLGQYAKKYLYPVTYAIYFRLFTGTNGGLSTSTHEPGKLICGFDIVSDPSVPGYVSFKQAMHTYFIGQLKAKPHWGKSVPLDVDYAALYGKGFQDFKRALLAWHQRCGMTLAESPLMTPFFSHILQLPDQSFIGSASLQPKRLHSSRVRCPTQDLILNDIKDDGAYGTKLRAGLKHCLFANNQVPTVINKLPQAGDKPRL